MAAETLFETRWGRFTLELNHGDSSRSLRAWDAADLYLLEELRRSPPRQDADLALFNDAYGALTLPLNAYSPRIFTDTATSRDGIVGNARANGLSEAPRFRELAELAAPAEVPRFDLVIVKIPKSLSLLAYQLALIRPRLKSGARLLAAGMSREIHTSTLELFEEYIGATRTSLAKKKARLIFSEPSREEDASTPTPAPTDYTVPGIELPLINLPGLFSRERLDPGTRLLLEELPRENRAARVADFGCGNGVIAIGTALQNPTAEVWGVEDSAVAVESARLNCERCGVSDRVRIRHGFSLEELPGSFDWIISNPPFHLGRRVSLDPTLAMFSEAREKLNPGGRLFIVANSHLGYPAHLRRIFGNCRIVRENRKFHILEAVYET